MIFLKLEKKMFKILGAKNRRKNLHKHPGPPFQIREGPGSFSNANSCIQFQSIYDHCSKGSAATPSLKFLSKATTAAAATVDARDETKLRLRPNYQKWKSKTKHNNLQQRRRPATKQPKNFPNWHLEGRLTKMTFLTKDKKLEGFHFIFYFQG